MEVLWYHVSYTDLIQQKGIYTTLWQQVNGGNTDAMELPVSRQAVKSKYNKLLRSLTVTQAS
jgi:hypothetical protein